MNTQIVLKKTLESISEGIKDKRNESLDSSSFSFADLTLSEYDIRENRDISKLKDNLVRDGQLQPITISIDEDDVATVVNGRTRYLSIVEINEEEETKDLFSSVKVEVYNDLTELEQDYLNAQINVSQSPLTPNEKINFVKKYKDELDAKALGKALGIADKMLENYIEVAEMPEEVLVAFSPKSEGYGRSDVKVEEAGKIAKAFKKESGGIAASDEILIALGKQSEKSNATRDTKRKLQPKIAKKAAQLSINPLVTKKYSAEKIVEIAVKETSLTDKESSGTALPKNSSEKYKIVDGLLKGTYDFAVLLFAESLYRIDKDGNEVDSETKRIIDNVDEIIVVGNEEIKLLEIEEYALSLDKKITVYNEDVIDTVDVLKGDDRRGFIYVNSAMLYAQRPEFINYLKTKYTDSIVAVVVLDLLFGKSQVYAGDIRTERLTVYSGAENFEEVIVEYKKRVKFLKVRQYATLPQKKYIMYV